MTDRTRQAPYDERLARAWDLGETRQPGLGFHSRRSTPAQRAKAKRELDAALARADAEPGPFAEAAARFLDWRDRQGEDE